MVGLPTTSIEPQQQQVRVHQRSRWFDQYRQFQSLDRAGWADYPCRVHVDNSLDERKFWAEYVLTYMDVTISRTQC